MSDEELLKAWARYQQGVGKAKAISELTLREVSTRTAELLVSGDYKQKPRRKLRRVLEALVKAS
jgi:hypothetical protein